MSEYHDTHDIRHIIYMCVFFRGKVFYAVTIIFNRELMATQNVESSPDGKTKASFQQKTTSGYRFLNFLRLNINKIKYLQPSLVVF